MKRLLFFVSLILIALYGLDASAQEWYLQREDLDIFVKEVGTGKDTVIVVHGGFGASHGYMMDAIKGLETKFHFILYDQPLLNEKVKTTIINGDYDFFDFHAKILKVLLNAYPNIHLMLIPAAGHNSWIDQPDQFKAGLSARLTR